MVIYVYKRQNSGTEPMHCKKVIRDRTKSNNKRVEDGTKSNTKKDKRWNQKGRRWNQGAKKAGGSRSPCCWHREASADPAEQLRRATGREVGRSLEKEFGSLKPWSVGDGVEHWLCGACSEGGLGEAEGGPPPMW